MALARLYFLLVHFLLIAVLLMPQLATAQLKLNFYKDSCPKLEKIVRKAVKKKINETFITIPATIRLYFHDCMVNGCDASIMIQSTANNTAERDHPANLSLAKEGFDTVIKVKEAVDLVPGCKDKVSCADILALATRDVIRQAGGPFYDVELGRRDGLVSKAKSVNGRLPLATFNLDQLTSLFASHGLSQLDMIALSAAHTLGSSHCSKFSERLYNFSAKNPTDTKLYPPYAAQLKMLCPQNVDPNVVVNLDPTTPKRFDNMYFRNLIKRKGLLTSDQILYEDPTSKPTVINWALNSTNFNQAFINAITKMGRIRVITGGYGNIRTKCDAFNL